LYKYRFGRFRYEKIFDEFDCLIEQKTKWSRHIRFAWDLFLRDQYAIKDTINKLTKAGFKPNEIMVFIICNWKIPFEINCKKLDLLKVWGVQVSDCWYDNQKFPDVIPLHWTSKQCKTFRKMCRRHNQIVTFRIDPEVRL